MQAIIPQPIAKQQQLGWESALKNIITDPRELLALLELPAEQIPWQWDQNFPLRVTQDFASRMRKGDPNDPLLKQVLSDPIESQLSNMCSYDPLKESKYNPIPGLLHKFEAQVLLTFTPSCAIHCRYCFRRHFPYSENNPGRKGWGNALEYIAQRSQIVEVILSGGDPLMAQDDTLSLFINELAKISHVRYLRLHTRLPVVIPQRITSELLKIFNHSPFQVVMVYHINHPQEIVSSIQEGVSLLKENRVTVLNQSVLLKDINDNEHCLIHLSHALFKSGILPYYINLLDPVQGASHFFVPLEKAKALQETLRSRLPGYLVPKFVKELPGKQNKTSLDQLF